MRSWLVFIGVLPVLETDVGRRQAEFRAAEHESGALGIVAGMRAHCVDVAPGALDRITEKNAAAAARLEQPVDGLDAPVDCLARVPFVAGARGERDLFGGAGEAYHFREVAEQAIASGTDLGSRLGEAVLHKRVLDDARLVADIDTL